jgi:8-oxo-dGTP pyrophosphatase MutT (NUDIX family)
MTLAELARRANPRGIWPGDPSSAALFARWPLWCDGVVIGSLDPEPAQRLVEFSPLFRRVQNALELDCPGDYPERSAALAPISQWLRETGLIKGWRDEQMDITAGEDGPALFRIERAATRFFGFLTHAAHLNAITGGAMWIARRSATKSTDPGLLDNLVAGGVAAALGVGATLVKEAWEEAGLDAETVDQARPAMRLGICRLAREGMRREIIHVYDLTLPAHCRPVNQDGEVAAIWTEECGLVAQRVRADEFTLDAALVIEDYLLRNAHPDAAFADLPHLVRLRRPL